MSKEYFRKRAKEYSERPEEQMGYLIMVIMEQEQDLFSIKDDSARKSALLNDQNKTIEVQNGTIAAQNDTIAALQAEIARTKLDAGRLRCEAMYHRRKGDYCKDCYHSVSKAGEDGVVTGHLCQYDESENPTKCLDYQAKER